MAKRLNWEKANSIDKTEKHHNLEHVTIAGAPDMDTIFGRKPTFMERSGLTARPRTKKRPQRPVVPGRSKSFARVVCPECGAELNTLMAGANHARAALRKHTKKAHKDIFKALLHWERAQKVSRKGNLKTKKSKRAKIKKLRRKESKNIGSNA